MKASAVYGHCSEYWAYEGGDIKRLHACRVTLIWAAVRRCSGCRFNRYSSSVPPLSLCDSDVGMSVSRRGGEEGRCCNCSCSLLYWRQRWSALPPLCSEFRRVCQPQKWFWAGRHGWIFEGPQLPFEVCSCFFQKPRGACAGCKLPDFVPEKLWVEKDNRCHPQHLSFVG